MTSVKSGASQTSVSEATQAELLGKTTAEPLRQVRPPHRLSLCHALPLLLFLHNARQCPTLQIIVFVLLWPFFSPLKCNFREGTDMDSMTALSCLESCLAQGTQFLNIWPNDLRLKIAEG